MVIEDNIAQFANRTIENWEIGDEIEDPSETAFRISISYDDDISWADKFHKFLENEKSSETEVLVVGGWGEMAEDGSMEVIDAIVAAADRLPKLIGVFVGEVTFEECEISWIIQTDVSPILLAFPNLTHLGTRGGTNLSLGALKHAKLEHLVIESGGLDRSVVQQIGRSELPSLKHLEVWLGTDEYGANARIDDIRPIVEANKFPNLEYLGLRDSHIADEVAKLVASSDIVKQLKVLDLSLGVLTDEGAQHLLDCPHIKQLKKLDIHHHFCSEKMMEKLQQLGIEVDISESEGADSEDRYVAVGE